MTALWREYFMLTLFFFFQVVIFGNNGFWCKKRHRIGFSRNGWALSVSEMGLAIWMGKNEKVYRREMLMGECWSCWNCVCFPKTVMWEFCHAVACVLWGGNDCFCFLFLSHNKKTKMWSTACHHLRGCLAETYSLQSAICGAIWLKNIVYFFGWSSKWRDTVGGKKALDMFVRVVEKKKNTVFSLFFLWKGVVF